MKKDILVFDYWVLFALTMMLFACNKPPLPSWQGVTIGKTLHSEVISLLGQPEKVETLRDRWIYYYPSTGVLGVSNRIWIKYDCDCVVRILINFSPAQSELTTVQSIFEVYGLPEAITSAFYPYRTVALIYPNIGRLFIAKDDDPRVEIVELFAEEYFVPMSLEQFWGEYGEVWQYDAPEWWDQYVQP